MKTSIATVSISGNLPEKLEAIAAAGLKIGVDPMGGAGIAYWIPIAERYGLNIEVVEGLEETDRVVQRPPRDVLDS